MCSICSYYQINLKAIKVIDLLYNFALLLLTHLMSSLLLSFCAMAKLLGQFC